MKQKIGVFLLSALLICSLSACGETGGAVGDNDILGDDYTTAERNYRQGTSANNGTNGDNYNQNKSSNKGTDTRKGVLEPNDNTGSNSSTGSNGDMGSRNGQNEGLLDTNGTSYEQMVRNGLVHDTDGDLTDGENSHS